MICADSARSLVRLRSPDRGALAVVAFMVFAAGCSTTVIPPAAPTEPVTAFLLDHGFTPSLVLPGADSNMTCYVYGDWNWYALGKIGPIDGLRALFWPSQGTLGRFDFPGPPDAHIIRLCSADVLMRAGLVGAGIASGWRKSI